MLKKLHKNQVFPHESVPDNEEEQPPHPHHDPGCAGDRTEGLREIWCVFRLPNIYSLTITLCWRPLRDRLVSRECVTLR